MEHLGNTATFIIGQATPGELPDALTRFGIEGAYIGPQAQGLWRGNLENAVLVKVDGLTSTQAITLARQLKEYFGQGSIVLEYGMEAYLV